MDVSLAMGVLVDLFSFQTLLALSASVVGGMIVGALPGLSAVMGIALLIPFTFGIPPATGIMMLMAVYTSAVYGGSIAAILLHTPGTPASAATALDGYQLTLQGKGGQAIRVSTIASAIGGVVSAIALLTIAPPLSRLSLRFGPPEYFLLAVFGLTIIGSLTSGSLIKGLAAGAIGLFFGSVGVDLSVGIPRFTLGMYQLEGGISLIPAMIGLFSLSQILSLSETREETGVPVLPAGSDASLSRLLPSFAQLKSELRSTWVTIARSSVIGVLVGILPGAGGDIGSWMGYNEAKRFSKHPEEFGKGSIDGIAGSEAANNAVTGAAMIPMFTLGIPGSAAAAVLLGGLMIHGLIPGRALFTTHARITYTAMFGLLLANVLLGIIGLLVAKYMVLVTKVAKRTVVAAVVTLCAVGAYAIGNNIFDVWIMLFFGGLGYLFRKYNYHPAPIVLGMILGPMAETRFTQTMQLARGNLVGYVMARPISVVLMVLVVLSIAGPLLAERFAQRRTQGNHVTSTE